MRTRKWADWADSCGQDTERELSFRYQAVGVDLAQARLGGEHWNGMDGAGLVETGWQTR